jgi:hypothetical protein
MCIIVSKPKGIKLKKEVWAECFRCNGHGAGLTYEENGDLIVDKGFFKFDDLYAEIEKHEEKDLVVHFRIASAGAISPENCHPFYYESENFPQFAFAIAHNGTLPWRSTKEESDTNCFVNDLLGPHLDRDPFFLDSPTGNVFLTSFIGNRNKLAIVRLDRKKKEWKTYIINKSAGTEDFGGVWFSNYSYRVVAPRVWGGYGSHQYHRAYGEDYDGIHKGGMSGDPFERAFLDPDQDWTRYGYTKHTVSGAWVKNRTLKPLNVIKIEQQNNLKLEGGIDIVVPRDADKEAKAAKELRRDTRLEHLSKKGRQVLRRMAHDYAKATVKDFEKLNQAQKVADFREEYRWLCKDQEVHMMSEECLDRYIVDKYKETGMFPDFMATPDNPEDGPIESDDDNPPSHEQAQAKQSAKDKADALLKEVEDKLGEVTSQAEAMPN